jgi:hypothetical protein
MPQERRPLRRDRRMDEPHRTSHYSTLSFQECLSVRRAWADGLGRSFGG